MLYHHVDVFSSVPYSGNSLAVFPDAAGLTGDQMRSITQELRHFESIFLTADGLPEGASWRTRVFDLLGELDFAGHPVIGAACVLHSLHGALEREVWTLRLNARTVEVITRRLGPGRYASLLDQGAAAFLASPSSAGADAKSLAALFSLDADDLDPHLPPEVISIGLRYLVLPVRANALARAHIASDITARLATFGAQFAYLLDAATLEGRHWNNDGLTEDVATGSGAGCAAAYLRSHELIGDGEEATLRQGRFTGRPSEMTISARGRARDIHSVQVGGEVAFVGEGRLLELPR